MIRKTFIVLAVMSLAPVQPLVFEPGAENARGDARLLASDSLDAAATPSTDERASDMATNQFDHHVGVVLAGDL